MIFERKKYLDELQAKCLIQLPSTIPFTKNYDIMHLYLRNHLLRSGNCLIFRRISLIIIVLILIHPILKVK